MKQTPIEFLVERLAENGILHSSDIHEANEMFKEQIIDAVYHHCSSMSHSDLPCGEQYYNQTYKK
jgi:TPP-dependent pyruvate/acetoin dehydrogenase alpha subunit